MKRLLMVAALAGFAATAGAPFAREARAQDKQAPAAAPGKPAERGATQGDAAAQRAESYFNFMMGHYYAEMYEATNRSEYATQAIEFYKKAYQLDPDADIIREQLAELYARSQRIRDAVTEAQDILRRDPDNLAARRLLARIYVRTLGDLNPSVAQRETVGRAAEQYREILRIRPGDPEAALWLARLYRLQNQHAQAEEVLRGLLQHDPDNETALEQLSRLLLDQARSAEAIGLLERVTAQSPAPGLLDLLGNAYMETIQFAKAEGAFRRAIELEPNEPDHRTGLARALYSQRKLPQALEEYRQLARTDPEEPENYLRMAQILRQMNKLDQAEEMLLQAKRRAPGSIEVIYHEALLYEAQGRYDDAARVVNGAIQGLKAQAARGRDTRQTLGALYEQLGRLYRDSENYAAARQAFQELGLLGPEEEKRSHELIIDTYRASREIDLAIAEVEKARRLYPQDHGLEVTQAMLLAEKGETDAAARILKAMLDGSPNDRNTHIALAQVYERGRRYADAVRAAETAEKMATQPAENEVVWFLLGAIYERQKKLDRAEEYFKKTIELNPRNSAALNYYGYMLADAGIRLDEAVALVERALEEDPTNGAYLDSLGWAYYRQNRLAEAEEYLRKAVARQSHDPTIRDHLGDVLFKAGRIELAAAEWEKSLAEWKRALPSEYEADKVRDLEKKLTGLKHRLAQKGAREEKP